MSASADEQFPLVQHIDEFHAVCDVLVVGSGAAGYAAALTAARSGSSVILLEKAADVGGTTKKSAGAIWIPNNSFMQHDGRIDDKRRALQYMARLSEPALYESDKVSLGLPPWQFTLLETFYDRGPTAIEQLSSWSDLRLTTISDEPDYYHTLLGLPHPTGRVLFPLPAVERGDERGNGTDLIEQLDSASRRSGVDVRLLHRVRAACIDEAGRVSGVVADGPRGQRVALGTRQGVVFTSGGFAHNVDMCRSFLAGPILGTCAARTNVGDFIPIAQALGAELANMSRAWMTPMLLEEVLSDDPQVKGFFVPPGDSMLMVNRYGNRVLNEKAPYNEQPRVCQMWDPHHAEYPNLLLIMVWDSGAQRYYRGGRIQSTLMTSEVHPCVVSGATLEDLSVTLSERLVRVRDTTRVAELDPKFAVALRESVERFNRFAASGVDPDFHRGESPMERYFYGSARPGNNHNPTMWPLGPGPFYATFVVPGTLDTKGGPLTNAAGQVLNYFRRPIPGLFGAGNCVASPSGIAYWGAGGTLGPALTFGHIAGASASAEPKRRRRVSLSQ